MIHQISRYPARGGLWATADKQASVVGPADNAESAHAEVEGDGAASTQNGEGAYASMAGGPLQAFPYVIRPADMSLAGALYHVTDAQPNATKAIGNAPHLDALVALAGGEMPLELPRKIDTTENPLMAHLGALEAATHGLRFGGGACACAARPPLLVLAHGGPTGAARTQLQLAIAYWTSRGFVVADVDYRGSTGYGRPYRHRLWGHWGVLDVEDCVGVASFLSDRGDVDPERMAIKGGSAGGFTVLAAVTFHDVFTAGASRYGVADLAALAADTHKFEARYLDRLVGVWPDDETIYAERSPINHTDRLATPMLLLNKYSKTS